MRLVKVAAAIAPEDFNICDIGRSLGSKVQSPKAKLQGMLGRGGTLSARSKTFFLADDPQETPA